MVCKLINEAAISANFLFLVFSVDALYDNRRFRERVRIFRRLDCARDFFPLDRFRGDGGERFGSTFFGRDNGMFITYAPIFFWLCTVSRDIPPPIRLMTYTVVRRTRSFVPHLPKTVVDALVDIVDEILTRYGYQDPDTGEQISPPPGMLGRHYFHSHICVKSCEHPIAPDTSLLEVPRQVLYPLQ